MKIEKINEDKIKITFDNNDLAKNNISVHSFMSNSIENQSLFLTLLDAAEKEVGFITDNYKISIETLTLNNGNFILIITRLTEPISNHSKPRIHTSRKLNTINHKTSLYKFNDFGEFCNFCHLLNQILPESEVIFKNKNSLYEYNYQYFLSIEQINLPKEILFKITSNLTEFAEFINISHLSLQKLRECGKLIIDKNAIHTCSTLF